MDSLQSAHRADDPSDTPCVGICHIDENAGLCVGCHRTLSEIMRWRELSGDERRAIRQTLHSRLSRGQTP